MRGFAAVAALTLVAACHPAPSEVKATHAWVRLPAVAGNPGAGYFTLTADDKPRMLLAVSAPELAIRSELHESMAGGGSMMSMKPLKQVSLSPGAAVTFAPGGKHVMFFDVSPKAKAGSQVPLTFTFADGKKIEVQATIVGAGDPEPK